MTGSITYLVDCSSWQGAPDWGRVAATCGGGAEKVTEGTGYVNPRWAAARTSMAAAARHGFIPLAYLFLDASGAGADQAQHFADVAGDLAGWGVVIDYERAPDGPPTRQQAVDAAARLRHCYPGHRIGAYAPHWYTAGMDLTFADWLWASEYVSGSGDPAALYGRVPASWWAPYGGRSPALLQFTPSASIAGISGPVDCSAFHGSAAQLAGIALPAPPKAPVPAPAPPPVPVPPVLPAAPEMEALVQLPPGGGPVAVPVLAAPRGCLLSLAGDDGAAVQVTFYRSGKAVRTVTVALRTGVSVPVVPLVPWGQVTVVELRRLDSKQGCAASACWCTWLPGLANLPVRSSRTKSSYPTPRPHSAQVSSPSMLVSPGRWFLLRISPAVMTKNGEPQKGHSHLRFRRRRSLMLMRHSLLGAHGDCHAGPGRSVRDL